DLAFLQDILLHQPLPKPVLRTVPYDPALQGRLVLRCTESRSGRQTVGISPLVQGVSSSSKPSSSWTPSTPSTPRARRTETAMELRCRTAPASFTTPLTTSTRTASPLAPRTSSTS